MSSSSLVAFISNTSLIGPVYCGLWQYITFLLAAMTGVIPHSENDDTQNGLARHCSFCRVREEMFSYW